jgi:hypothetical protein
MPQWTLQFNKWGPELDNNNPYSHFDSIGLNFDPEEIQKHKNEQEALGNKLDYLIHRTFAQTDAGKELLELWTESLLISPGANPGMDNIEIGMREGQKQFIRNIILTIRKVEKDE